MLNEASIKKYIEESLKRRNQWDYFKPLLELIYNDFIPLYAETPYWTSNDLFQLRKLYFIEYASQVSDMLKFKVHLPDLLFATVCTDLALVEDEFNPLFKINNKGIKSATILQTKYKDLMVNRFGYKPWDDTNSILPPIRAYQHADSNYNKTGNNFYTNPCATALYDVEHLANIFTIGFSGYLKVYMHDFMIVDGYDFDDCEQEIEDKYYDMALRKLNTMFGRCGTYNIQTKALAESPEIMEGYNKFRNMVIEHTEG